MDATTTFDDWLKQGYDLGFCGSPVCPHSDGIPMSLAEETATQADGETRFFIVRLYQDSSEKRAVERHHPPSWRRVMTLGW